MLIAKGLVAGLIRLSLIAAVLLAPAGTWEWPRAIWFLTAFSAILFFSILVFGRIAPHSLEARLQSPTSKNQPLADRLVFVFIAVSFGLWLAFIPVDVFHLKLLPEPQLWVTILGACILLTGYGFMLIVLLQNAFAAPIVQVQRERGHHLIDTGLYGHVRHPLYSGFLVWSFGLALWLESYAAALLIPLMYASFLTRIHFEERTLRETLPGYVDYTRKVPYRLAPYVW